jgi:beta-N-acetylhexosaminidase
LDRDLLEELRPIGVVLFRRNFAHQVEYAEWLGALSKLIAEVRRAIGREKILIGIDHEGGRVWRVPDPLTRFAAARVYWQAAQAVGDIAGYELASLGINLCFGPVLDLDAGPAAGAIGDRSFGDSPERVVASSLAFAKSCEMRGVRICGKHFPGHGGTTADSHYEMPVINGSSEQLKQSLKPFQAAVNAGFGMIMTAHLLVPELDPNCPATLSRITISDVLRTQLGFDGVVISDDLGMGAISEMFETADAGVHCLRSGHDVMLVCSHWADNRRACYLARAITRAIETDRLFAQLVQTSANRIHRFVQETCSHNPRQLPDDWFLDARKRVPMHEAFKVV